jgi:hypothetical protein
MPPIRVHLDRLVGTRTQSGESPGTVVFDVDVKMDEENRTNEELTIGFLISIGTKPSIVHFEVGGKAVISGGRDAFDDALEVEEGSNVPRILPIIYQRIFTSLFVISSMLESPYPPPDLIHSPTETRELGLEVQSAVDAEMQQAQRAT